MEAVAASKAALLFGGAVNDPPKRWLIEDGA